MMFKIYIKCITGVIFFRPLQIKPGLPTLIFVYSFQCDPPPELIIGFFNGINLLCRSGVIEILYISNGFPSSIIYYALKYTLRLFPLFPPFPFPIVVSADSIFAKQSINFIKNMSERLSHRWNWRQRTECSNKMATGKNKHSFRPLGKRH